MSSRMPSEDPGRTGAHYSEPRRRRLLGRCPNSCTASRGLPVRPGAPKCWSWHEKGPIRGSGSARLPTWWLHGEDLWTSFGTCPAPRLGRAPTPTLHVRRSRSQRGTWHRVHRGRVKQPAAHAARPLARACSCRRLAAWRASGDDPRANGRAGDTVNLYVADDGRSDPAMGSASCGWAEYRTRHRSPWP